MDRADPNTRELLNESCIGFNDQNEPTFKKFPDCSCCNTGNYTIVIQNNKPIIEAKMLNFPNCKHCNTDNATIIIEEIL